MRELASLPREIKSSPLYKRLASNSQRHYYFIHLANMVPIEESNVMKLTMTSPELMICILGKLVRCTL